MKRFENKVVLITGAASGIGRETALRMADEGATLGLRVIVDGRLGFASTNQTDAASLERVADDAVAIAKLSPPDEANVLPEPETVDDAARMGHRMDTSPATLGVAEVVERAQELDARATEPDERISIDQASFSVVSGSSVVLSTKGVEQSDLDAALTMSLMGFATDGDETGARGHTESFAPVMVDTPLAPGKLVDATVTGFDGTLLRGSVAA